MHGTGGQRREVDVRDGRRMVMEDGRGASWHDGLDMLA